MTNEKGLTAMIQSFFVLPEQSSQKVFGEIRATLVARYMQYDSL